MNIGLEVLKNSPSMEYMNPILFRQNYTIAGTQHNLRVALDIVTIAKYGWPAGAFSGFNKFINNSDKLLADGFKHHVKELGDYMDPESCKRDNIVDPTYENFKKLTKFNTVVFSRKWDKNTHGPSGTEYCAICGDCPWDIEHGVGIIINNAGTVIAMRNFMSAYEWSW